MFNKPEPSCSSKDHFLNTHVIFMGFQMSRQVLFLHTELNSKQKNVKAQSPIETP